MASTYLGPGMVGRSAQYLPSVVRETLDSVVSPEVREHILRRALQSDGLRELPDQPRRMREFLEGSLRDALVRSLGSEFGASILSELSRIVTAAERDEVARTGAMFRSDSSEFPGVTSLAAHVGGRGQSTMPSRGAPPPPAQYELDEPDSGPEQQHELRQTDPYASHGHDGAADPYEHRRGAITERAPDTVASDSSPPPSSANYPLGTANALGVIGTASVDVGHARRLPLVLVVSSNSELVRCFGAWLDPRATVQRVRSLASMFQELTEAPDRRVVIVLDAKSPSMRPLSLAAVADELPKDIRVLLWGVGSDVYAKMLAVSTAVAKWMVVGTESSTREVVAHCARIVG